MVIKKDKIRTILLPLFPENESLQKYWWHKAVKFIAIVISISSLFEILWLIFLFYLMPQSWMDLPLYPTIYNLSNIIGYLPVHFTSLLSGFPIYQTAFHALLPIPIIGPLALIFILISFFYIAPSLLYRLSLYVSQRFYMRRVKIILLIVTVVLGSFIFSTWKYQQIINEDSIIADEQCLKVNPFIIQRKNSFINSMKVLQASGSADEYWAETNNYLDYSKKYITAQKTWLTNQNAFMKRQDFAIFIPAYMKKAAQLQYDSREAEMKATSAIVEYFETYKNLNDNQQKTLSNTITDETNKSNKLDDEYNKLYDSSKGKFDLRNYFTTVPQTTCPPENFNIPNVPDMLNPQNIPLDSPLS